MGYFRATGLPHSGNTANQGAGSSNDLVAAPGANKRIVIYDVIVVGGATQIIREGSGGSIKMYLPEGHVGLTCPIALGANLPLWIAKSNDSDTSFAVTVTYSIEKI